MNAIISGATKGIGKAVAFELAGMGYSLVLAARSEKDLLQIKNEISQLQPKIIVLIKPCDFSVKEDINEFASFVKSNFLTTWLSRQSHSVLRITFAICN